MLHIVLLILKIMGIFILAVLGLILLLVLIILLTPAVYQISLKGENTIDSINLHIKFHWLYYLLSGSIIFENGRLFWKVRTAWKIFSSNTRTEHSGSESNAAMNTNKSAENSSYSESEFSDRNTDTDKNTDTKASHVSYDRKEEKHPGISHNSSNDTRPESKIIRLREKIQNIYNRICRIPEKIKYTFSAFCDKIKSLKAKKDKIIEFLESEVHKSAFRRFVKELKRFLKFMKPSKASIDLHFGFNDPAYTGYFLAGLSILYPCIGEYGQFTADFEHKILCGNLFIKGKFRAIYALIFALGMIIDKNVRQTYRHIRKFKI